MKENPIASEISWFSDIDNRITIVAVIAALIGVVLIFLGY